MAPKTAKKIEHLVQTTPSSRLCLFIINFFKVGIKMNILKIFTVLLAFGIFTVGCSGGENDIPPCVGEECYTTYNLLLGEHPIALVDQTGEVTEALKNSIQTVLGWVNDNEANIVSIIKTRDNVKIIVEDAPSYDGKDYNVIDGRTMAICIDWLKETPENQMYPAFSNGFGEMSQIPLNGNGKK